MSKHILALLAMLWGCGDNEPTTPGAAPEDELDTSGTPLGVTLPFKCQEAGTYACSAYQVKAGVVWTCTGPNKEVILQHRRDWEGSGPRCQADGAQLPLVDRSRRIQDVVRAHEPRLCGGWVNETSDHVFSLLLWWPPRACPLPR